MSLASHSIIIHADLIKPVVLMEQLEWRSDQITTSLCWIRQILTDQKYTLAAYFIVEITDNRLIRELVDLLKGLGSGQMGKLPVLVVEVGGDGAEGS